MDSPKVLEYLGVDVGAARVGIARGNSAARLAQPIKVVAADQAMQVLFELAQTQSASGIVIGLPRSLDGQETAQTKDVRQWADELKKQISLPLYWQDEALTSQKADTDDKAAALILQDFLDSAESDRVAI